MKNWVRPVASRISDEPASLVFLSILLTSFIVWVFKTTKKGFLLLSFYLFIAFVAIVLRAGDWWIINHRIALVVIAITFFAFLYSLWRWYHHETDENTEIEVYDAFDRRKLSEQIVSNLLARRDIGESFNFCLLGEWGSGKTHMFKMIKKEIRTRAEYNKDLFLFEFSPWHHSTSDDLERELIKQLAESDNPELRSIFDDLLHLFYGDNSNFLSKASAHLLRRLLGEGKDVKARLNDFLRREGNEKHIIILFDDIDRLDRDEIRATLKIIRNILDYKNIHFGVGFDLDYLGRTLFRTDLKLKKNPFVYLDKFFQLKIDVPTVINLRQYFLDFFLKEFPLEEKSGTYKRLSIAYDKAPTFKLIKTPRDVENIIYNSKQAHIGLEKSTDLVLILLLETRKLKDPQVYKRTKYKLSQVDDRFMDIDRYVPKEFYDLVGYSKESQYPLSKKYYRNYFESSMGEGQIDPAELQMILNGSNVERSLSALKKKIDDGYGPDIFQRVNWMIRDNRFTYETKHIELVVKAYEHFQGNHFVPFMGLVSGPVISRKDLSNIKQFIYKAASKDYYYRLYFILGDRLEKAADKLISLLQEVVENEGRSVNRHLYFVLAGLYTHLKDSPSFGTKERRELLGNKINRFITTIAKTHPWYFMINFVIDVHWRDFDKEIGRTEYMIFNSYIPELVSTETMKRHLNRALVQKPTIDDIMKKEILEFLDLYQSSLNFEDQHTVFKFSQPHLFRDKPGVEYDGKITIKYSK